MKIKNRICDNNVTEFVTRLSYGAIQSKFQSIYSGSRTELIQH
jgi:hypothetical protein